ncbi:hypothetical protein [Chitinophaga nivalis]|uniref:Lipoprotein n=1 Tax=Chitinophaga nivalis TaxID=2991709 RepID=A0ABT3IM38_9BACT|nr:hypothetical protein [Chitinophaga nivalis]MCW3465515.1 hypothetical protein [Chitinophaga nivalis]MCW3484794.1 hypothetical protein [Chitinophaga nivalis]
MKCYGLLSLLLLQACFSSNRIYHAPAMGAESQFEKGLRPEKRPQYLFDKTTMKAMQRQGSAPGYTPKRRNTAPTIPLPKKTPPVADSLATAADSSRVPADTTHPPLPADTTHIIR